MCYTKEKMVVKKNDGDWRTSDNSQGTATDNRAIEAQQTTSSDDYEKPSPQSQHKKSSKKARGQTGHKGHNMALDNPERIEHNLSATLCKLS